MAEKTTQQQSVQTTGHAWDGDLQEFNNPLPNWWLWAFYATMVFTLVYWVLYPSWPVGDTYLKGVLTTTYKNDAGEEVTTGWNTRAEFIKEMQEGEEALKQKAYLEKVEAASYEEINADPDMTAFTQSLAKVIFADNCGVCHGMGGAPAIVGLYPNLRDDAWLWGGKIEQIHHSIAQGRQGYMPGFAEALDKPQIKQLAHYVLSLSGNEVDAALAAKGGELFQSETAGCYYCHTKEGTGMYSQGAANLTDAVWTVADVPGQADTKAKVKLVEQIISKGIQREMPAWAGRLSDAEIKLLTVYVHNLGGGQ